MRLVHSTRLERIKEGAERRAATLAERVIDGINLHRRDWNGGLVALFHRFDRIAFGWDMQFEHELRDGLRMGLDGVYSDHVDVMIDAYEGRDRFALTLAATASASRTLGQNTTNARPTRSSSSIGPSARLSYDPPRLSPITNTWSSGTTMRLEVRHHSCSGSRPRDRGTARSSVRPSIVT